MSVSTITNILIASCIVSLFVMFTPVSAGLKYERTIAFTVERTTPISASSDPRDIGGFNRNSKKIYINIGEVLDVITGRFKAPLEGVYYFYYSFSSTTMGATTQIELLKLKNGKDLQSATSQVIQTIAPSTPNPLDSASASVMVKLERGDQVFLRLGPGSLDASRDRPLLFTGYMLYREGRTPHGY
ncbi:complement C1q tumor necrosis factor-related protein 3-like isoform X2 [Lytechinus variegatus]|nr:complement C1q tumor necrosis factor-related protein 3-like isoform X2 [Lytechinus variegatus]